MTLPTSRDDTYGAASQVKSALLNRLQDMIVGAKRPSAWRWINASTPNILNVSGVQTMAADRIVFAAGGRFSGLPLGVWAEGDRITGYAVKYLGNGAATTQTFDLRLNKGDGAPTTLQQLTFVNPPATWQLYTVALATPHVMGSGEALYLDSTTTAALVNASLAIIGIQSDRL